VLDALVAAAVVALLVAVGLAVLYAGTVVPFLVTVDLAERRGTPNGVLGDPTGADVARGETLLRRLVDDVVGALQSGQAARDGCES